MVTLLILKKVEGFAVIYRHPLCLACSVCHVWPGFIIVPAVSGYWGLGCRRYDTHTVIHNLVVNTETETGQNMLQK